jgi:filamentous hemagglutinin
VPNLTRIKNNQITDATIQANAKVVPYSITSGLLANNLTYGSDLTVAGNLTVQGNSTAIDSTITTIEDPVILLASTQTGSPTVDIGFIGRRGDSSNIALVWREANSEFITAFTSTGETNSTITISSYANFHTNNANVAGNLTIGGNVIGNITFDGTLTAGNLATAGYVSATGNATAGNVITAGLISATGTATVGNVSTAGFVNAASVSASGNIDGNNVFVSTVSASGNITGNNISSTNSLTGANISTGGHVSATGTVFAGNVDASTGTVGANVVNAVSISAGGNIVANVGVHAATVSASGDVTGGNVLTGGIVSAAGNITANASSFFIGNGSQLTGVTASSVNAAALTGDTLSSNVLYSSLQTVGTLANLSVTGYVSAAGNITAANFTTSGSAGNITGANIISGVTLTATGNVYGNYFIGNGSQLTGIDATRIINGTSNVTIPVANGNIQMAVNGTADVVVVTATGANVTGYANVSGNVSAGNAAVVGNVNSGNILTTGQVSATGNVYANTVVTSNIEGQTQLTISTVSGDIVINPAGANVDVSTAYIINLANPVNAQDAATKQYVDDVAQGLNVQDSTQAATPGNLANISGGVVSYNNGNAGVGANLVTTGTYTNIDGVAINTVGTRILVKDEANTAHNGIYTYSNATVLVRATDYDTVPEVEPGDFVFNLTGTVYGNTGWVQTSNTVTMGTGPIVFTQFSGAGQYQSGNGISLTGLVINTIYDGNITVNGSNQLSIANGAILLNPNITNATGTGFSATGNIDGGNFNTGGIVTATGNVTGGNINTVGLVAGGNITSGGTVSAGGNIQGNNIIATTEVSAATVSASGTIQGGNIGTAGIVTATGNITGGNISTAGQFSATGTATAGNVLTGGEVSAVGNITANAGSFFIGNGSQLTGVTASSVDANSLTGNTLNSGVTFSSLQTVGTLANVSITGFASAGGNVTGANIFTAGDVSASGNLIANNISTSGSGGNITGANVIASVTLTATGNVYGANVLTGGLVSATGNVIGGNVLFGTGYVSGTGNVYAANFIGNISGNIDAAGSNTEIQFNTDGDILGANANFTYNYATNLFTVNGGNILAGNSNITGATQAGNVTISGDNITGTNGIVTVNGAGADINFAVSGDTVANVFFVDAGTDTASFGSSAQTTNAVVAFNATNSILMPVGNTVQRPATGVTGMLRFNTTLNYIEIYNNTQWQEVGQDTFTVIVDEQFNGDGSTVAFTLGSTQTTSSVIVSINGVVQIPTTAYAVAGTDPTCVLTFTEAPQSGDLIDVRELTTTVSVTSISFGNSSVTATGATVDIQGNLNPTANLVYSLGNATNRWSNLFVGGNTIYLGNLQLKEASANTFAVFTADGVTEANIAVGNIDVTSIQSGTSTISIAAPNGNAILNVAGNNTVVATSTGANITGYVNATGNITGGNVSATNLTGTLLTAAQTNITSVGTLGSLSVTNTATAGNLATGGTVSATGNVTGASLVGTIATASQTTITEVGTLTSLNSGTVSSSGNVTGANLLTGGIISATGNITGGALFGGGFSLTGNTITSPGPTLTIDPNGAGGTDGNVVITGNLTVQGTTTTINSNTISTNDLTINMANNAANATAANNGGIEVGPVGAPYATLLYNTAANVWVASLGISSSGNVTGTNLLTGGLISATGNVNTGNVLTGGLISATGNAAVGNLLTAGSISATGNATVGGIATAGSIFVTGVPAFNSVTIAGATVSAAGNITGGNLSVGTGTVTLGNIVNANGNGVGNIGSSSLYFNTVFAKATSAQYADLAEKYTADAEYAPGTVVSFGGDAEVTQSGTDADRRVAGVVSTNPSYIMNGGLDGANVVTVALTGRVPTKVTGQVRKGDLMVSNGDGTARAEADPKAGAIIGKALENFNGATGVIEVVIGRF